MANKTAEKSKNPNEDIEVRSCSYVPRHDMIKVSYENGKEEMYLEVKYRVKWFQTYCKENGIRGSIDDSETSFIPALNMIKAVAVVRMDDWEAGRSAAGVVVNPSDPESYSRALQTVCTFAKGRALANAGFGTLNSRVDDGDFAACDSGYSFKGRQVTVNPDNPLDAGFAPPKDKDDDLPFFDSSDDPAPAPASAPTPTPQPAAMSLKEALAYEVPMGNDKGRTLGEINGSDPGKINFWASEKFVNSRYPELKEAAKVIQAARG